jgi:hypothetical protein
MGISILRKLRKHRKAFSILLEMSDVPVSELYDFAHFCDDPYVWTLLGQHMKRRLGELPFSTAN